MNRKLVGTAVAAFLALTVTAGCDPDTQAPAPQPADVADCDADDKAKKETPDCGFYAGKTFVWWSWVKAGKTKPPAGWNATAEKNAHSAVSKSASPKASPRRAQRG